MKTIRALIIEDEAPARELIRFMLADHPEVEIVGECVDGFCGARGDKGKETRSYLPRYTDAQADRFRAA
jgi:hypothetical protein